MNVWFKFVSLLLCTSSTCIEYTGATLREKRRFELHGERQTYSGAIEACQSLPGGAWGLPDFQQYQDQLVSYIQHTTSITSPVWLSWRRITLQNWTWTDGSLLQNELKSKAGSDCAGLALEVTGIRVMDCTERHIGFVCQVARQVHDYTCPELYFPHACINTGSSWYVIGCGSQNWQDARTYCTRLGGDLAVLDSPDKQQLVLQYLTEKKLLDECSWLYLGLRKEDWISKQHNNDTSFAGKVFWDKGEPRHSKGNCSQLHLISGKPIWKTASCLQQSHVICQNYGPTGYKHQMPETLASQEPAGSKTVYIIIGVFLAFLVVTASIVTGVICYNRFKTKRKEDTQTEQMATIQPAAMPTIVMFSSGISNAPMNSIITEINLWDTNNKNDGSKMAELAVRVLNNISTRLINNDEKSVRHSSNMVRIININAVDKDGSLPEAQAKSILESLCASASNIDVVCLPDFSQQVSDPEEILVSLWALRKKTVVITLSKRMFTFPASEVISVGKPGSEEDYYNRDLDVRIPSRYEQIQASPFAVAGLIAQIKYLFKEDIDCLTKDKSEQTHLFRKLLLDMCTHSEGNHGVPILDFDHLSGRQLSNNFVQELIGKVKDELNSTIEISEESHSVNGTTSETLTHNLKVKVCIIGRGFNINERFKNWSINVLRNECETALDNKYITEFITVLQNSKMSTNVLQKVLEFNCFNVVDEDYRVSWKTLSEVFDQIIKDKCDILLMPALTDRPPATCTVIRQAVILAETCVFICPAKVNRNCAPIDFPGEIAIAVAGTTSPGDVQMTVAAGQPEAEGLLAYARNQRGCMGSLLDFKCRVKTTDLASASSYCLSALVIDVLIQAESTGLSQDDKEKLRHSHVMHEVIKYIIYNEKASSGEINETFVNHTMYNGWGVANPSEKLTHILPFGEIIKRATSHKYCRWNGKNV